VCNCTIDGSSSRAGTLGAGGGWMKVLGRSNGIVLSVAHLSLGLRGGDLVKTPKRRGVQTVSLRFSLDGALCLVKWVIYGHVLHLMQLGAGVGVIVPSPNFAEAG
jgi:hypothetical protein